MENLSWKKYFAMLAKITALRSKDQTTKVGAIFVDKRNRIIATGYNGMPKGNDKFPWDREGKSIAAIKYSYVVHAEINGVLNATKDLKGATVYTTLFPCSNCAKILSQVEVDKIYYLDDKYHSTEDAGIARFIFDKTNVKYEKLDDVKISF